MTPAQPRSRGHSRPTLRDVARALQVSVATVSNAYNRPDQLSGELRDRILTAARDMGYPGPNPLARSLRRGKTGVIALVYDAPLNYAFADPAASLFLGTLAATIQTQGLNLLLLACPDSTEPVRAASVDGFIVYCSAEQSELLGTVLARALPTVLVEQRPRPGTSQVGIDDLQGAQEAARHLAELGHTHIGILPLEITKDYCPDPVTPQREAGTNSLTTARRFQGYRQGAPQAHFHILETAQNTPQEGEERARELLTRYPQITALLCMSDVLAHGALNAARSLGRRVPQDLSIIGFDDLPSSEPLNLTSVWQPTADKGRQAGEALLAQLAGDSPSTVTLPTRLVVRGTTGKTGGRS
ncbi:LacI family DNA-binding transcriptional regulator [Deinococcus fonticola]|uniref:LacI family DNA-binding transcriptional regulator n=1 Tax=Deinococcus fonticola TaxID=2528713 RepID=UPI0010754F06|nr:LacI family DNA-binding transcriptional regulator [Deinococcus fonticola]